MLQTNHRGIVWIAHAGMAARLPGGAPTDASLARAVMVRPDAIELDVCATADGRLVLRHDLAIADGVTAADLTLSQLQRLLPETLTLDEGLELTAPYPILLDVKTEATAAVLARRLARRPSSRIAVCTEIAPALELLRQRAPRTARILSLPDAGSHGVVAGVVGSLLERRSPALLGGAALALLRVGFGARRGLADAVAPLAGVPWRPWLAQQIGAMAAEVGAGGVSLHHWLVTPDVVEAAVDAGLSVISWTVNRPHDLERMLRSGVGAITSDRVGEMRRHAEQLMPASGAVSLELA